MRDVRIDWSNTFENAFVYGPTESIKYKASSPLLFFVQNNEKLCKYIVKENGEQLVLREYQIVGL